MTLPPSAVPANDDAAPDLLGVEREVWSTGFLLIGVDEVGRGPLAGPVVAAAVCFPMGHATLLGVRDSKEVKKISERTALASAVRIAAMAVGLGAASVREIERHNIRRATALAMRRAINNCRRGLPSGLGAVLAVDGLPVPELQEPHRAIIKGDGCCHAIAAASLVAKVARDELMLRLSRRRPGYGWETNAGYGTVAHVAALLSLGLTPHHRSAFCATATMQPEFDFS